MCWQECEEIGTLTRLVGVLNGAAAVDNGMAVHRKKTRRKITMWSSNSTPGYSPKRIERRYANGYLYTCVHSSITRKSQEMEATQAAVGRSTDERKVTHVQCGQPREGVESWCIPHGDGPRKRHAQTWRKRSVAFAQHHECHSCHGIVLQNSSNGKSYVICFNTIFFLMDSAIFKGGLVGSLNPLSLNIGQPWLPASNEGRLPESEAGS